MIYARDLPSGVNAHISGDAIGVSAGGWGITGETDMSTETMIEYTEFVISDGWED